MNSFNRVICHDKTSIDPAPVWIGSDRNGQYYWLTKYLGSGQWNAVDEFDHYKRIQGLSPARAVELAFYAGEMLSPS